MGFEGLSGLRCRTEPKTPFPIYVSAGDTNRPNLDAKPSQEVFCPPKPLNPSLVSISAPTLVYMVVFAISHPPVRETLPRLERRIYVSGTLALKPEP